MFTVLKYELEKVEFAVVILFTTLAQKDVEVSNLHVRQLLAQAHPDHPLRSRLLEPIAYVIVVENEGLEVLTIEEDELKAFGQFDFHDLCLG